MGGTPGLLFGGHEIVLPIVGPLVAGALVLVLEQARSRWAAPFGLAAMVAWLALAVACVQQAHSGAVQVYLLGNWQAPWGVALALDRLSALMLLLAALVALASVVYALGGESRRGPHFHSLLQFQLMGLNGAFLTTDLFNLFVFFEVLLAASYGLLLHGATRARLAASVHYVAFNLVGSALFLVAATLLYGVTGTLNMADLALRLAALPPADLPLAQAAGLLLLVVFAVKAALLPLYFWLPEAYASASAPVAALFAILTKVGVYAIARSTTLFLGGDVLAGYAPPALTALALGTLVLASLGVLAATRLRHLIAYLVVASAGTLLLALGLGGAGALAAALVYLVHSTLAAAAWFLLADRISAARGGSDRLEARALTRGWASLGAAFVLAAVAAAGMPPLAGFFGKALLLQAAGANPLAPWVVALVLGSSLATMTALARAGSTLFWKPALHPSGTALPWLDRSDATTPAHAVALAGLLGALVAVALGAGALTRYAEATARQLLAPAGYVHAVLSARPVPPVIDLRREMRERGEAK